MKKLTQRRVSRKSSTVGAVGTDRPTAPGEQARGLPHGSNGRSYLTIWEYSGQWGVVRVDFEGSLGYQRKTMLVSGCLTLLEASQELALWAEGTGLPVADYRCTETFDPAGDPGWR